MLSQNVSFIDTLKQITLYCTALIIKYKKYNWFISLNCLIVCEGKNGFVVYGMKYIFPQIFAKYCFGVSTSYK